MDRSRSIQPTRPAYVWATRIALCLGLLAALTSCGGSTRPELPVSLRCTVNGSGFAASNLKTTVVAVSGSATGGLYYLTDLGALELYGAPIDSVDQFLIRVDGEEVFRAPYDPGQGIVLPAWTEAAVRSVMDTGALIVWGVSFEE